MSLYLVRYLDWDWEESLTLGLYKSWTDVLAFIAEEYPEVDIASINQPQKCEFRFFPLSRINIDSGYGKTLIIEEVEIE